MAAKFGFVDVDEMANQLTPAQFREWQAVAFIDGWDNEWNKTAEILSMIHASANRICIMLSADPKGMEKASMWISAQEFVKNLCTFGKRKEKQNKMMSIQQAEQVLASRYGRRRK